MNDDIVMTVKRFSQAATFLRAASGIRFSSPPFQHNFDIGLINERFAQTDKRRQLRMLNNNQLHSETRFAISAIS